MKKVFSLLMLGGILAVAACGPSEADKKAADQKRNDSIAAVEKAKLDSMAIVAADAAAKAAEAEAAAAEAQSELKDAKADAKNANAAASAAKKKADEEAAAKKKAEEDAEAAKKKSGGKLLDKTGGTQNGKDVEPAKKGGKLKDQMN